MSTIISNLSFHCRITKPILLPFIRFGARDAVETNEVMSGR